MPEVIISSETLAVAATALAALSGVALGAWLTHRFNRERDHLEMKRDVLRRALGYRWQLTAGSDRSGIRTALNEIPVVFAGDEEVEEAIIKFHRQVTSGNFRAEDFFDLATTMAKSAQVPHEGWNQKLRKLIETPLI